jgi:ATP synthase protein I
MASDLAAPGKKLAKKGLWVQALTGTILVLLSALISSDFAKSSAFGVAAFLIPHSIFSYWVFRYAGATKNRIVAQSFNQGMKLKLIITALIFVFAFSLFNAHPLFVLGAYAITLLSQWMAMLCFTAPRKAA